MEGRLTFKTRTTTITIDYSRCKAPDCGFACVKACRLYGRGILKIERGLPKLAVSEEEARRLDNECLACEIHCEWEGGGAIRIDVPL